MTKENKRIGFAFRDVVVLTQHTVTLSRPYLHASDAIHMAKEILDYYDVGRSANLGELRNEHAPMESLLVERLDNILAEALRSVDMSFGDHITRQRVLNTIGQLTTVRRELIVFLLTEDPKQETNMNQYINTEA